MRSQMTRQQERELSVHTHGLGLGSGKPPAADSPSNAAVQYLISLAADSCQRDRPGLAAEDRPRRSGQCRVCVPLFAVGQAATFLDLGIRNVMWCVICGLIKQRQYARQMADMRYRSINILTWDLDHVHFQMIAKSLSIPPGACRGHSRLSGDRHQQRLVWAHPHQRRQPARQRPRGTGSNT